MRAEDLVALAAARGVDLLQAARIAATKKAAKDIIRKKDATILVPPPENRAKGSATRSIARPEWTVAELGQAAQGVPTILFQAACYAFAGDRSHFWPLHGALYVHAVALANEKRWPVNAKNIHHLNEPYLQCMAKLVLDEDALPAYFRIPTLGNKVFAIYMNIEEKVWDSEIAERFEDLKAVWTDWLQTSARIIQRHLVDEEYA